jgi:hypothetical protein
VRFPSLEVQRLEQTYDRLEEGRYRYRSGRFTADLVADGDGIVLRYGMNWKASRRAVGFTADKARCYATIAI